MHFIGKLHFSWVGKYRYITMDHMHNYNDGWCSSQKNVKASEKLLLSSKMERRENFYICQHIWHHWFRLENEMWIDIKFTQKIFSFGL